MRAFFLYIFSIDEVISWLVSEYLMKLIPEVVKPACEGSFNSQWKKKALLILPHEFLKFAMIEDK